jgi:hypothetical protein
MKSSIICKKPLQLSNIEILLSALTQEVIRNELDCLRVFRAVGVSNFEFITQNSHATVEELIEFLLTYQQTLTFVGKFTDKQPTHKQYSQHSTHLSISYKIQLKNLSINKKYKKNIGLIKFNIQNINYLELGDVFRN